MVELLSVLVVVLIAVTIGASAEYYRQVRKAQKEYEKAKSIVEDVVLSFNRDLKREADRLELVAYKVEGNSARAEAGTRRIDTLEKNMAPLESQLNALSEKNAGILPKLTDAETKMREIGAAQETLKTKVAGLEEQVQKLSEMPEVKIEPVIPIRRDKAMSALTDTEVTVLEMLSTEGPKTAPEIKDRVHLSREHTARLMKKLYEEGYLEREVGKIPFRYSVKKEMEKFLKKAESEQT